MALSVRQLLYIVAVWHRSFGWTGPDLELERLPSFTMDLPDLDFTMDLPDLADV